MIAWHVALKHRSGDKIVCKDNTAVLKWDEASSSLKALTSNGALVTLAVFERESGSTSHDAKRSIKFEDSGTSLRATLRLLEKGELAPQQARDPTQLHWLDSQKNCWRAARPDSGRPLEGQVEQLPSEDVLVNPSSMPEAASSGSGLHPLFQPTCVYNSIVSDNSKQTAKKSKAKSNNCAESNNSDKAVKKVGRPKASNKRKFAPQNDFAARIAQDVAHGKIEIDHWRFSNESGYLCVDIQHAQTMDGLTTGFLATCPTYGRTIGTFPTIEQAVFAVADCCHQLEAARVAALIPSLGSGQFGADDQHLGAAGTFKHNKPSPVVLQDGTLQWSVAPDIRYGQQAVPHMHGYNNQQLKGQPVQQSVPISTESAAPNVQTLETPVNQHSNVPPEQSDASKTTGMKPCSCKNSRCLKKYCICFAAGVCAALLLSE